jgi:hypothetical protein
MAEAVRFELTEHFYSTVFKTVAISRTRPHFLNLVEYPGIEPGVPEGGGFTVHCITIDASTPYLVGKERLELSILSALASKTRVYTIPPLAQIFPLLSIFVKTHCPSFTLSYKQLQRYCPPANNILNNGDP